MFDCVLNTLLAGIGKTSSSLKKKNQNVINFALKKSGKKLILYSEMYLETSQTSTMKLFWKKQLEAVDYFNKNASS